MLLSAANLDRRRGQPWTSTPNTTSTAYRRYVDDDSEVDIELAELPPPALDGYTGYPSSTSSRKPQPASQDSLRRRAKACQLLEDEMKFSHSIQFNAVPDWSSHYISYSNLKKLIYQLEKEVNAASGRARSNSVIDAESSPLLPNGDVKDPDKVFTRKLDDELEKICSFYQLKELEIYGEVDALLREEQSYEGEQNGEPDSPTRQRHGKGRPRSASLFQNFVGLIMVNIYKG